MRTLFVTNCGSHMWKMERPDSDTDLFKAYIAPTYDILSGIGHQNSHFGQTDDTDTASHEVGVVINQLIKGNVNFIWGVHSPLIVEDEFGSLAHLRELTRIPSANCYHSIKGLAYSNYTKYVVNRDEQPELWQKRMNMVCRTLLFGINVLHRHEYWFEPVRNGTPEKVEEYLKALDDAKAETTLAQSPVWEKQARDWLFAERMTLHALDVRDEKREARP